MKDISAVRAVCVYCSFSVYRLFLQVWLSRGYNSREHRPFFSLAAGVLMTSLSIPGMFFPAFICVTRRTLISRFE